MQNGMQLSQAQLSSYREDGFLILPEFIDTKTCIDLTDRAAMLLQTMTLDTHTYIFSTRDHQHVKQKYFLESGDKIHYFFEDKAFDDEGKLKYDKLLSINKIGHALHRLDPVFYKFSYQSKFANLVKSLGINNPLLAQSMYIYKQPKIGGEVTCHQDSTFLFVEGQPVIGLWVALQDATIENGCLWAIPGGHQTPLKSRMRRVGMNVTTEILDETPWELNKMQPLEVTRGSLVILHGLLPHMSKENTSNHSRHAFSLHLFSGDFMYAKDNWLQPSSSLPFLGFNFQNY